MVKKHQRSSEKASSSSSKKIKNRIIWDYIVNNDEYLMELNEGGTTIKCIACADAKGKNGGIFRMRHPFTIGAWNSYQEHLQKYMMLQALYQTRKKIYW